MNEIIKREIENMKNNIVQLRKDYRLSKKQMTKIMGIGIKSFNKIENGEIPPKMKADVLFNIEEYFGITPVKLFSDWNNK